MVACLDVEKSGSEFCTFPAKEKSRARRGFREEEAYHEMPASP
jgi:hypothetical protein